MSDDLHTRLTAALRARLEVARAATPGPWTWGPIDMTPSGKMALTGPDMQPVVKAAHADVWPSVFDARHIAANDPATEIRRVEALLRVVERHAAFEGRTPYSPGRETQRVLKCSGCSMWTNMGEDNEDYPCPDIRDLAAGEGIEVGDG